MVDATYIDNGRIQVINNDDISFDTDRPSITMLPREYWIEKTDFQFSFPNLIQARAYARRERSGETACELWSTVIWQEWGPDEATHNERYFVNAPEQSTPGPTTRPIPRTLLGTVPAAANWLDFRVRLRRTNPGANWYNTEPPYMMVPENQWFTLNGGSCPTEWHTSMSRLFNIERIGNNIYLAIYQSTFNSDSLLAPGGQAQANINGNQSGAQSGMNSAIFTTTNVDPTGTILIPKSNTELAVLISHKPYDQNGNKRPNDASACTGAWPDTTSTYSMDLIVAPCVHKPAN